MLVARKILRSDLSTIRAAISDWDYQYYMRRHVINGEDIWIHGEEGSTLIPRVSGLKMVKAESVVELRIQIDNSYGRMLDTTFVHDTFSVSRRSNVKHGEDVAYKFICATPSPIYKTGTDIERLCAAARHTRHGVYLESPEGIIPSHTVGTRWRKHEQYNKLEPIGTAYVLEELPLGYKLTFNPKRAQNLIKRRKRAGSPLNRKVTQLPLADILKPMVWSMAKRMLTIVPELNAMTLSADNFCYTYRNTDAVTSCLQLNALARRLGIVAKMRPSYKEALVKLKIHRKRIQKMCDNDNDNAFMDWWDSELRIMTGKKQQA